MTSFSCCVVMISSDVNRFLPTAISYLRKCSGLTSPCADAVANVSFACWIGGAIIWFGAAYADEAGGGGPYYA